MPMTVEQLVEKALELPSELRARLADLLVESLDTAAAGRIEQLWAAEAKRRRDEVRAGQVQPVPGDEVFARARRLVKR